MEIKETDVPSREIVCDNCQKDFNQRDNTKIVNLGSRAGRNWQKVGLECPHCQTFFVSFYNNNILDKRRKEITNLPPGQEKIDLSNRFKRWQIRANIEGERLFSDNQSFTS